MKYPELVEFLGHSQIFCYFIKKEEKSKNIVNNIDWNIGFTNVCRILVFILKDDINEVLLNIEDMINKVRYLISKKDSILI